MKKILLSLIVISMVLPFVSSIAQDIPIPTFKKWKDNPIMTTRKNQPGQPVYFDSSAVTDPSVVFADGRYHMFYTGWVNWIGGKGSQGYIGYAISADGKSWTKVDGSAQAQEIKGAVLAPGNTQEFDGQSVESPSVLYDSGKFRMYYVGIDKSGKSALGYAESSSGIYWTKKGKILEPTNEQGFDSYKVGSCSVVKKDNQYLMWYEGQSKLDSRWRIGYAVSSDGSTFTKNYGNEKTGGSVLDVGDKLTDFDNLCVRHPSVIWDAAYFYMWYDTSMRDEKKSQIGIAISYNGTTWEKKGMNLDVGQVGEFDSQRVASPCVIRKGIAFEMFYCNFTDTNSGIGYASSGDTRANVGSGIGKIDCKAGQGFDLSLGANTTDFTLMDIFFDCGFGQPRMCGRWKVQTADFDNLECVDSDGYPAISNVREYCQPITVGTTYAFKTINEQCFAKVKITGIWQDPVDPTHYEITFKWMYQPNGSNCFIAGKGDPPGQPYNLNCVAGDRQIKLSWTKSFAPAGKIISYYVYRGDRSGDAAKDTRPIADFPTSDTNYLDVSLINGKTYYYVIRAVDQYGNISPPSNECFSTPQAYHLPPFPTPTPPAGGGVTQGDGTREKPFIIESNPWQFDWCGFQPQTMVIIQGKQYIADGSGCIHVSIDIVPGRTNEIEYTIITPTGEVINGKIYAELQDTTLAIRMCDGSTTMDVNGQGFTIDAPPENFKFVDPKTKRETWRYVVSYRALGEALKCTVDWDQNNKKATLYNCLNKIEVWMNKPTALVNGQPMAIDDNPAVTPMLASRNGKWRTLIPYRFVAEILGAEVTFNSNTKCVEVKYNPPKCP